MGEIWMGSGITKYINVCFLIWSQEGKKKFQNKRKMECFIMHKTFYVYM